MYIDQIVIPDHIDAILNRVGHEMYANRHWHIDKKQKCILILKIYIFFKQESKIVNKVNIIIDAIVNKNLSKRIFSFIIIFFHSASWQYY